MLEKIKNSLTMRWIVAYISNLQPVDIFAVCFFSHGPNSVDWAKAPAANRRKSTELEPLATGSCAVGVYYYYSNDSPFNGQSVYL